MEKQFTPFGGGRPRIDSRYFGEGAHIVDLLKAVRIISGLPNHKIACLIGVSPTSLSMGIGGRAGKKKMEYIEEALAQQLINE